ncbi:MAG: glycosyltransferase [Candidatus Atribacteria bacterium]|nr:glycosyltransferase [Candidatus Atribacteria bacterium]
MDLYKGLSSFAEIDAKVVVKPWARYPDKNIIPYESCFAHFRKRLFNKLQNRLLILGVLTRKSPKTDSNYSVQDYDQTVTYSSTKKILNKTRFKPDAIIVTFMQNFLSFKNIYELNEITNAPVYIYMMDMAPMTGGCHYAWDCKGYLNSCGNCPAMYSVKANDQSRMNWLFKKERILKTNITAVAATEYQYRQLQQGSMFKEKSRYKILLGIDNEIYRPGNKKQARQYFHLPVNRKIIFFGAMSVNSGRKGYIELIKSLEILKNEMTGWQDVYLAIAGRVSEELRGNMPFDHSFLGYLAHTELALAFQAADLFLSPSVEDSGPMMINQAIMCGTPVVAFEMGVALDLVITGKTGYRAKLKDCRDLATGINYVVNLGDSEYLAMTRNCAELGQKQLLPGNQAKSLIHIFNHDIEKIQIKSDKPE